MKNLLLLFSLLFIQTAQAQTSDEFLPILRERVEIGKTNQSIVLALINEKGTQFVSYGKTAQTVEAKNSDENTIFEIGSLTKVFTTTLLAEAVRRGEVKLDDPISKFLPANVKTPTRGGKEITLLDLATHTSGLPRRASNLASKDEANPYADYTVAQMYEFLSGYELPRDIGKQFEYSNFGTTLLGHILSLKAKMSYEDLVKMRILKPLKMNDTMITLSSTQKNRTAQGFNEDGEAVSLWDFNGLGGAGALRSTAKDMAKFITANIGLTKTDLSADFVEARKPLRDGITRMKIGLGWHIAAKGSVIWHNGATGGFHSFAGFMPEQKKGIVILTNSAADIDDIGGHFLIPSVPLKKIMPYVVISEKTIDEYIGDYQLMPDFILTITRRKDKLFVQATGQAALHFTAEAENTFNNKSVGAQIVFNRGADGKIESLTLNQGGSQKAKKIK
jgi:serine-type D-Ala-D-Ala carboxypeptidase/endopeptidase